jgi:hypothetical protein
MYAYPGDKRRRVDWDLMLDEDFTTSLQKHWSFPLPGGACIFGPMTVELVVTTQEGYVSTTKGIVNGYWVSWDGLVQHIKRQIDELLQHNTAVKEEEMGYDEDSEVVDGVNDTELRSSGDVESIKVAIRRLE